MDYERSTPKKSSGNDSPRGAPHYSYRDRFRNFGRDRVSRMGNPDADPLLGSGNVACLGDRRSRDPKTGRRRAVLKKSEVEVRARRGTSPSDWRTGLAWLNC